MCHNLLQRWLREASSTELPVSGRLQAHSASRLQWCLCQEVQCCLCSDTRVLMLLVERIEYVRS
jgi:hypothetical protein